MKISKKKKKLTSFLTAVVNFTRISNIKCRISKYFDRNDRQRCKKNLARQPTEKVQAYRLFRDLLRHLRRLHTKDVIRSLLVAGVEFLFPRAANRTILILCNGLIQQIKHTFRDIKCGFGFRSV